MFLSQPAGWLRNGQTGQLEVANRIRIPMYLVCKVQIQTSCGLSYANLASELCADNLWIGHLLTHALLGVSRVDAVAKSSV